MKDIGLVLVQSARRVAHDPLISGLGHGLEEILVKSDMRLVTRVVSDAKSEARVYRSWKTSGAVDGVVLLRLEEKDARPSLLDSLGVPFAAVVDEGRIGDFSGVIIDGAATMRTVLDHLVSRGHSDIVYVSAEDPAATRSTAFVDETEKREIRGTVVVSPLTREGGARATTQILALAPRPTAVIYDDDVTAVSGLDLLIARGVAVPAEMAVVAWNDSVLCQAATPPLTAVSNETHTIGQLVGRCLIDMETTGERTLVHSPASFIVERSST
jgi:DNA-binding LacI/PurR family transcriptional regulator